MSRKKLISDAGLFQVANTLDQLINADLPARGVIGALYGAAKALQNGPLTLAAVQLLEQSICPGDAVFIITGWAERPDQIPNKSETDGPAGAVALARAIALTLGGRPVIITDDYLVADMEIVLAAADCRVLPEQHLILEKPLAGSAFLGAVAGVPVDREAGLIRCRQLVANFSPACCLSIERGAANRFGRIHSMNGLDCSHNMAQLDQIFLAARERGIATIGIGDGGNEIGMANIEQTVRRQVPNGNLCHCPCGAGIAPDVTRVDVLLTAAVSNWAGYALSLLLALSQGDLSALDDREQEQRVLSSYLQAGFHDSASGLISTAVDGCEEGVSLSLLDLLRQAVFQGIKRFPYENDDSQTVSVSASETPA